FGHLGLPPGAALRRRGRDWANLLDAGAGVRVSVCFQAGGQQPVRACYEGGRISPEPRAISSVGTTIVCSADVSPSSRANSRWAARVPIAAGSWASTVTA